MSPRWGSQFVRYPRFYTDCFAVRTHWGWVSVFLNVLGADPVRLGNRTYQRKRKRGWETSPAVQRQFIAGVDRCGWMRFQ